jgi:phosphoribosyl 1,2-cyclic phosphodiesterase
LTLHPFAISHDARDPSGFTISRSGRKVGIATDLGIATGMVKHHLQNCSLLVMEANHDPAMLTEGPYPWPLKQRIKSRSGHLSNQDSRDLLGEIKHDGLCHVVLAHLSETNNTADKALRAVQEALNGRRPIQAPCRLSGSLYRSAGSSVDRPTPHRKPWRLGHCCSRRVLL